MSNMPAVLVGIPAVSWVYTEHVVAMQRLQLPPGSQVVYTRGGCSIAAKRAGLAERVVADERFGSLLYLDSDVIPTPDLALRLLGHHLPVVGALYFQRFPPFRPCAGHFRADGGPDYLAEAGGPDPVRRVDWIGTGALLVQRDVFIRAPRPWFDHPAHSPPGEGEDIHFCRELGKSGIAIHCDTGLCCPHLATIPVDLDYVQAMSNAPAVLALHE